MSKIQKAIIVINGQHYRLKKAIKTIGYCADCHLLDYCNKHCGFYDFCYHFTPERTNWQKTRDKVV